MVSTVGTRVTQPTQPGKDAVPSPTVTAPTTTPTITTTTLPGDQFNRGPSMTPARPANTAPVVIPQNAFKQPLMGTHHVNDYLGPNGTLDADKMRTLVTSDPRAASMITQATKNYGGILASGARISISSSAGNGGEPVLTMVPKSLQDQPQQKFNTQVHYHGDQSRADLPSPGLLQGRPSIQQRMVDKLNGSPPTVMVLPEQPAAEFGTAGQSRWGNVKDTGATAKEALATSGVSGLDLDAANVLGGELVVSSHSRGVHALLSAHEKGGLKANRLELHDNLWDSAWNGRWGTGPRGKGLEDWATSNPNSHVNAVISNGTESSAAVQQQAKQSANVTVIKRNDLGHDATALAPIR